MLISTVYDIPKYGLSRADALTVRCPQCGASPSYPCTGRRVPTNVRVQPHLKRYNAVAERVVPIKPETAA